MSGASGGFVQPSSLDPSAAPARDRTDGGKTARGSNRAEARAAQPGRVPRCLHVPSAELAGCWVDSDADDSHQPARRDTGAHSVSGVEGVRSCGARNAADAFEGAARTTAGVLSMWTHGCQDGPCNLTHSGVLDL